MARMSAQVLLKMVRLAGTAARAAANSSRSRSASVIRPSAEQATPFA